MTLFKDYEANYFSGNLKTGVWIPVSVSVQSKLIQSMARSASDKISRGLVAKKASDLSSHVLPSHMHSMCSMQGNAQLNAKVLGQWHHFCCFGPLLQHIVFEIRKMNVRLKCRLLASIWEHLHVRWSFYELQPFLFMKIVSLFCHCMCPWLFQLERELWQQILFPFPPFWMCSYASRPVLALQTLSFW